MRGWRQLKQDMDMVRLPVELCQISPETLLYQIFRMNLKKSMIPGLMTFLLYLTTKTAWYVRQHTECALLL